MPLREAIILAGGLGTRLRTAVPELPKCMAPVNGRPFISFVTDHLRQQGIERFIFSLGYKSDLFMDFITTHMNAASIKIMVEQEPLGTGGAIQLACKEATTANVTVVNGDSLFAVDLAALAVFHEQHQADCTLALKPMTHFSRYGSVTLDDDDTVVSFNEKKYCEDGLINGGVYILRKETFLSHRLPEKFSFENDYLQRYHTERHIYGMIHDAYFIDIGIPEDYDRAQQELKTS